MNQFILPVMIESRKIIFLDLESDSRDSNVGEDVYIVEIPSSHQRKILSISKSKSIQSLHEKIDDLEIKTLGVAFKYDAEKRTLLINLSNDPTIVNSANSAHEYILDVGLTLKAQQTTDEIRLILDKTQGFKVLSSDHLYVHFNLDIKEDIYPYSAPVKFFLANQKDMLFSGFDFGSEASQMCEGRYSNINLSEMDLKSVDIFSAMKSRSPHTKDTPSTFIQYESSKLYKSIFFASKTLNLNHSNQALSPNSLDTITPDGKLDNLFFSDWVQIPNLKLMHNNGGIIPAYNFTINTNGKGRSRDLGDIKKLLYSELLRKIIIDTLADRLDKPVYLHFTLLVPNIYTIEEIIDTKSTIRSIFSESELALSIKGLEISSLSESDAAFLGYYNLLNVKAGSYYIIIDCGKGTTDFSIIQVDKDNTSIVKPIYRNGFAGAGNLINFAFIQSVLSYMEKYNKEGNEAVNFKKFKDSHLTRGHSNLFKYSLFHLSEKWKKNFNLKLSANNIEDRWNEIKSGDVTIATLFQRERTLNEVIDFIKRIDQVGDWDGHIGAAVNEIVKKIRDNLAPVIMHMNKTTSCGGILFTGRGFLFKYLEELTKSTLRNIRGMESVEFIDNTQINLKEICLHGVFTRNIISYSDIASNPIEVKKGTLRQITKADIKESSIFSGITKFFNNLVKLDGEYYNEETNSFKVINLNFKNTQFLIGGKIYQPDWTDQREIKSAHIVHSRKGFFIRAKDSDGHVYIRPLIKVLNQVNQHQEQKTVEKSLFPGWFDPELLNN